MNRNLFWQHCGPGSKVAIERDGKQWPAEVVSHTAQRFVLKSRKTGTQLKINIKLYVLEKAASNSIRLLRANGEVITVITPATNWDKVIAAHQEEVRKSFQAVQRERNRKRALEPKQCKCISLTDKQIMAAIALGGGNLSLGVRRAITAATGVDANGIKSRRRSGKKNRPSTTNPRE